MFELHSLREIEPVQEWASVGRDGPVEIVPLERLQERADIARDDLRIQPHFDGSEQELRRVEIAAQRVTNLFQHVASMLSVTFGPQIGGELVATYAPASCSREQREKGEWLPLLRCANGGDTVPLDRQPT